MPSSCPTDDLSILARHLDRTGGRYALYPPPRAFRSDFGDADFVAAVRLSNGDPIPRPLSLHFEVPAAYKSCFCCECGSGFARDTIRATAYLQRLVREIGLVGSLFDRDRDVVQVSLAPGTTRLLDPAQVEELLDSLSRHFHVPGGGGRDFALTIEASENWLDELRALNRLGFNRVGFGLGHHAGRDVPAPAAEIEQRVGECRDAGFSSVRVDLPYGAAHQDQAGFLATLQQVLRATPDRIGLRDCAHVSETSPLHPNRPGHADIRAGMLLAAADILAGHGYLHVGMDVFAREGDALVLAQRHGRLHRNALGYSTHGETDLVGFGVGAINQIGGCHAQSNLRLRGWEAAIDSGRRAIDQGLILSADDEVRWEVIRQVLCDGRICVGAVEDRHHIDFTSYFARELQELRPLFEDGLMAWDDGNIVLGRLGQLVARVITGGFDGYFHDNTQALVPLRAQG